MSAVIVIAFFSCSLLASYVLFRLLKSTARVGKSSWQAGGALAGFVIVFLSMQGTYKSISDIESTKARLTSTEADLQSAKQQLAAKTIAGKIQPNLVETKVVLAVAATDPDGNGLFRFDGRCLDPVTDDLRLYFIREGRHVFRFLEALPKVGEEFDITQLEVGQEQ